MKCKKCNEDKPIDQFRKYPKYLSHACKECERKYHNGYNKENLDRKLYKRQRLLLEGQSYCGRCESVLPVTEFGINRATKTGRTGTCKNCKAELQRKARLKRHYGLDYDMYQKIIEEQEHKCKICSADLKEEHIVATDHCHKTGVVRGILCNRCNRAIGMLKDDVTILQRAIEYLSSSCKIPLNGETPEEDNPVLNPLVTADNA